MIMALIDSHESNLLPQAKRVRFAGDAPSHEASTFGTPMERAATHAEAPEGAAAGPGMLEEINTTVTNSTIDSHNFNHLWLNISSKQKYIDRKYESKTDILH